jgi:hypothetical protein
MVRQYREYRYNVAEMPDRVLLKKIREVELKMARGLVSSEMGGEMIRGLRDQQRKRNRDVMLAETHQACALFNMDSTGVESIDVEMTSKFGVLVANK